jgi:hypothetical protein
MEAASSAIPLSAPVLRTLPAQPVSLLRGRVVELVAAVVVALVMMMILLFEVVEVTYWKAWTAWEVERT